MDAVAQTSTDYPINKANARELANKRWQIWREKKNALKLNPASSSTASDYATNRAKAQIDKVFGWMDEEKDRDKFSQLTGMLDRLWNKAFPTQGAVKSRSGSRQQPISQPIETPEPPQIQ